MVERLPVTLQLSMAALLLAIVVGIPVGVIAGYRHNSATDVATVVGSNIGVSIPVFVLGLFLQFIFAKVLADTFLALPPSGQLTPGVIPEPFYEVWGLPENGLFEFISNIDIVNAILTLQLGGVLGRRPAPHPARHRTGDHPHRHHRAHDPLEPARHARARLRADGPGQGPRERMVVGRHALRNSLLPVVTVIGLSLGTLLGGAILTETIFSLTGVGKTLFDAISCP